MTRRAAKPFDQRLLSHHPAGKACVDACLANGWQPGNGDVLRLVRLWDEVRQGRRSEVPLSRRRLQFARWLVEHGHIGEDSAA
ncbi:MAG: hypothetical protein ACRDI2_10385 [Chloroflexota bacterium]